MTPAIVNRTPTAAIIEQIETNLCALMLADGVTKAFGQVRRFDQESLVEAFRWLHLAEQRVCVIVPLDETFPEAAGKGTKLFLTRVLPVALLISDRVIGDRVKALYGDPAAQPVIIGAYGLQELVLPVVTGTIVTAPAKAVSQPMSASLMVIKDKQQTNLPGRSAIALELHIRGGSLEANIGPGPIL